MKGNQFDPDKLKPYDDKITYKLAVKGIPMTQTHAVDDARTHQLRRKVRSLFAEETPVPFSISDAKGLKRETFNR